MNLYGNDGTFLSRSLLFEVISYTIFEFPVKTLLNLPTRNVTEN